MKAKLLHIPDKAWRLIELTYQAEFPGARPGLSAWIRARLYEYLKDFTGVQVFEKRPLPGVDPTLNDSCYLIDSSPDKRKNFHNKKDFEEYLNE